jgi:hypothetical protein
MSTPMLTFQKNTASSLIGMDKLLYSDAISWHKSELHAHRHLLIGVFLSSWPHMPLLARHFAYMLWNLKVRQIICVWTQSQCTINCSPQRKSVPIWFIKAKLWTSHRICLCIVHISCMSPQMVHLVPDFTAHRQIRRSTCGQPLCTILSPDFLSVLAK